jgi:hypothetical protein
MERWKMIELRWKVPKAPDYGKWEPNSVLIKDDVYAVLQYRYFKHRVDASGAINVLPAPVEYSNWRDVEISDD